VINGDLKLDDRRAYALLYSFSIESKGLAGLRQTILGALIVILAFLAPFVWDRLMNQAPEWAW
jgi:hypothetical protein